MGQVTNALYGKIHGPRATGYCNISSMKGHAVS
jgi:hypothetical protein